MQSFSSLVPRLSRTKAAERNAYGKAAQPLRVKALGMRLVLQSIIITVEELPTVMVTNPPR